MKVKDIARTANMAWSPASVYPVYMACGTAAQQLDASFNTLSALEIFSLDPCDLSKPAEPIVHIPTDHRFSKLCWGSHYNELGAVIGGTDAGQILVYSATDLIAGSTSLKFQKKAHSGSVSAMDLNPFQSNLLASGSVDSELFIWDLTKPDEPMEPGAKLQPTDKVSCVSWNHQVQQILCSSYPSGPCVVWDLRKSEPIIKLSEGSSKMCCRASAWHPDVATQLVVSSEDDSYPVIQLWDLRMASSPLRVLKGHTRGVLGLDWCLKDPDLLISCGKDDHVLLWDLANQDDAQVALQVPTTNQQWLFDVKFCLRNPSLVSVHSSDGHISTYSLMGGVTSQSPSAAFLAPTQQKSLADSFGADIGTWDQQATGLHAVVDAPTRPLVSPSLLRRPPKWMRPSVGATFGFGGKLIVFSPRWSGTVVVWQVETERDVIMKAGQLSRALYQPNGPADYCEQKNDGDLWKAMAIRLHEGGRNEMLSLLGYSNEPPLETAPLNAQSTESGSIDDSTSYSLDKPNNDEVAAATTMFDLLAVPSEKSQSRPHTPFSIETDDDTDGLISQALLIGKIDVAIEACLRDNRMADAVMLGILGGDKLLDKVQKEYYYRSRSNITRLISSLVGHNYSDIVRLCDPASWKEILATLLTYVQDDRLFSQYTDQLGDRLNLTNSKELRKAACLCFVLSGNVDRLVTTWDRLQLHPGSPLAMQECVELATLLSMCSAPQSGEETRSLFTNYAGLLCSQGQLVAAYSYLEVASSSEVSVLKDRLYHALPPDVAQLYTAPTSPYQRVQVSAPSTHARFQSTRVSRYSSSSSGGVPVPPVKTTPVGGGVAHQVYSPPSPTYTPSLPSYGILTNNQPTLRTMTPASYNRPLEYAPQQQKENVPPLLPHDQQVTSENIYRNTNVFRSTKAVPSNATRPPQYFMPGDASGQAMGTPGVHLPAQQSEPHRVSDYAAHDCPHPLSTISAQLYTPATAWNDPPTVVPRQRQRVDYTPTTPIKAPIADVEQIGLINQIAPEASLRQPAALSAENQNITARSNGLYREEKELPTEHVVLKATLEDLLVRCGNSPGVNLASKRKLDDVNKRLAVLYSKLKNLQLSISTTDGLHKIIQSLQNRDYWSAIQNHNDMVSTGSFTEISEFMPGLKSLIQMAAQLQV